MGPNRQVTLVNFQLNRLRRTRTYRDSVPLKFERQIIILVVGVMLYVDQEQEGMPYAARHLAFLTASLGSNIGAGGQ